VRPRREYIITEEQLCALISGLDGKLFWDDLLKTIRSRSAHSKAPPFDSADLLLLAHDEWTRREERKRLYDEASWLSGFIDGLLTDRMWARGYVDILRTMGHP
jgi:hypothetical protein